MGSKVLVAGMFRPPALYSLTLGEPITDVASPFPEVPFPAATVMPPTPPTIRLHAYNGLQLVYLSGSSRVPVHPIVYSDERDLWLAREAQRAGARRSRTDGDLRAPASGKSHYPDVGDVDRAAGGADGARALPLGDLADGSLGAELITSLRLVVRSFADEL